MLINELPYTCKTYVSDIYRSFSSADLFVPGTIDSSVIHVCYLSEAIANKANSGECYVCVIDNEVDDIALDGLTYDVILVDEEKDLRLLFNNIHNVFQRLNEWEMSLEKLPVSRDSLAEIVTLSENILGNFLTIQDGTFKLIAYTENLNPPGEAMSKLVNYGYQAPETMELYRQLRQFEEFYTCTDVTVSREYGTKGYDVVKQCFISGDSLNLLIVMICSDRPANPGLIELFKVLSSYVKRISDAEISAVGGFGGIKRLCLDIITNSIETESEARVRASYCGFKFDGLFVLFTVSFPGSDNPPVNHFARIIRDAYRSYTVFIYSGSIIILRSATYNVTDFCKSLERVISVPGCVCGISYNFSSLWALPVAYKQCQIAINEPVNDDDRGGSVHFRFYTDCQINHFVRTAINEDKQIHMISAFSDVIFRIRQFDENHRTNVFEILKVYLENDRKATPTADFLHMHRNTIIHHIEHIEEYLGISLDDAQTRLLLLLAYKIEELGLLQ